MAQLAGHDCFSLKSLQEVLVTGDGIIDHLDRAELVEGDVPSFIDRSHAPNANSREDFVLVTEDHSGLKLLAVLQPGLIRRTDVVITRIDFVARGTIFHRLR